MSSNPAPRPALARTETGPTRPKLRRPEAALAPGPAPTEVESPATKGHDKTTEKPAKAKKAKHGHKDGSQVEVTVTLSKQARRLLKDAANERDMTPEDLASLVLSAWLDR
jgi:hypothetical protein